MLIDVDVLETLRVEAGCLCGQKFCEVRAKSCPMMPEIRALFNPGGFVSAILVFALQPSMQTLTVYFRMQYM